MDSTEIMTAVVERGGFFLWERAVPRGELKRDLVILREADGHEMVFTTPGGEATQWVLPETLNDLIRASFVKQDHSRSDDAALAFLPTRDGIERFGKRSAKQVG